MKVKDFNYNSENKKIYCITDKGIFSFNFFYLQDLIPFKLSENTDILKNDKIKKLFIKTIQDLYVQNPLIFDYVKYIVYYNYRGKQKKKVFNIYIDAVNEFNKLKKYNLYNNIHTNFKI